MEMRGVEELKDEDMMENVQVMSTTTATTTPNSNVITITSSDQSITKVSTNSFNTEVQTCNTFPFPQTIVIENFSDHTPEMQKDILNAILASDIGVGMSGQTVATLEIPGAAMAVDENMTDGATKSEVDAAAAETSYHPVTVEEFEAPAAQVTSEGQQ